MGEEGSFREVHGFRRAFRRAELLGFLLTLLVGGAVVFSFLEIRAQKGKVLAALTRVAGEDLTHKLEGFFRVRTTVIRHFRELIQAGKIASEEAFRKAASVLQKRFPGFLAINWVDKEGRILWVAPAGPTRAARGKSLFSHPDPGVRATFAAVVRDGKPRLTPPVRLYQGGIGFATYFPVLREGTPTGYLNGVFQAERMADFLGGFDAYQDLAFKVRDGERVFLSEGLDRVPPGTAWLEGLPVKALDRTWTVQVAPKEALLERAYPWTDWGFLAIGLSLALGLGWSFFLARKRFHELRGAFLALRTSKERYRLLLENMDEGICLCREGRAFLANKRFAEILGYDPGEILGKKGKDVLPGLEGKLAGKRPPFSFHFELEVSRKDGSTFPALIRTVSFREEGNLMIQVVLRDLTQEKAAEREKERVRARLVETQKLESLGLLAGGIAHDFNNLLTGILGNASLAEIQLPQGSPAGKSLKDVVEAARRAASLVRELLAYAGRGRMERKVMDLSFQVERVVNLLPQALRQSMRLSLDLRGEVPPIEGDPAQLQQIVMNLLVNAAEAVKPFGGSVRVETGCETLRPGEEGSFAGGSAPPPGDYLFLRVRDEGPGMDTETLSRIFDPFFSTKGPGRGLGLASVLGILKSWGGGIRVESAPGRGTLVEVFFPAVETALPRREEGGGEASTPPSGTERVLVVDDEEVVRKLAKESLESFGFRVLLAENGKDALEIFRREGGIDVVVLDMVMPGLDGRETMRAMRSLRPGVKMILTSGFPGGEEADLREEGWSAFLMKPFTPLDLAAKVAEVLGRA